MSIKITIEKTTERSVNYLESFVTHEKPTDQRKTNRYSESEEVIFEREYAVRDCVKTETKRFNILEQTIEDDADFDLVAVIAAINGMKENAH